MEKNKNTFVFYMHWEDIFNCFENDRDVAALLRAIFAFVRRGEIPDFDSEALAVAFADMKHFLESDKDKWERKCAARAAAGRASAEKRKKLNQLVDEILTNAGQQETEISAKEKKRPSASPGDKSDKTMKAYGEYMHVLLSDEQRQKLINDFGNEKTAEYIRRVDEYTQQTGKRYKDYYLTIRQWIWADKERKRNAGDHQRGKPLKGENSSLDVGKIEQLMNDRYKKKAPNAANIESTQK